MELLSTIVLVVMFCLAMFVYLKSPNTIPSHFDASGKPHGFSNKLVIFVLPLIGNVIYYATKQLVKFPNLFNYAVTITKENAERRYELAIKNIRVLQLAMLIIFTIIILMTYLTIIGITDGPGFWFLPFALCMGVIPIIIILILILIQSLKTK